MSDSTVRLIADMVRDYAFLTFDVDTRITFWSAGAQQIFGWTEPEILGQPGMVIFTPEDREKGEPLKEIETAKREGRAEDDRWHLRKDGSRFWASGIVTALRDDSGQLNGFAKVLRDLTERKRDEQQRERLRNLERDLLQRHLRSTGAELDQSRDALRALAAQLMTAQEDERRHIARELHDDLAQRMAVLELELNALAQRLDATRDERAADIARLREHVGPLADDLRRLSQSLHPSTLERLGIDVALRDLVDSFARLWPAPVDYSAHALPPGVPVAVATGLYRVVQEALRNVSKHAPGAAVAVLLKDGDGTLDLTIED